MPLLANIMQVLAGWNTAKQLNTVAQGRREAAHPGIGSKTNPYAEGVIQLILAMDLFNPFGGSVPLLDRHPGCGRRGDRPWPMVCNAYGVCRDRHMHIPSKRGDANELTSLTLRVSSAHRAHSHLGQA